jgi:hypothetical protein
VRHTGASTPKGACISARSVARRYGVPPDATCWRYLIEHPELGWSFAVRAVWRDGKLMPPVATHTVIESYYAENDERYVQTEDVAVAVNEWLAGL